MVGRLALGLWLRRAACRSWRVGLGVWGDQTRCLFGKEVIDFLDAGASIINSISFGICSLDFLYFSEEGRLLFVPPHSRAGKSKMRWLVSLLLLCLCAAVNALSSAGNRLLVIQEEESEKQLYSTFWEDLESKPIEPFTPWLRLIC